MALPAIRATALPLTGLPCSSWGLVPSTAAHFILKISPGLPACET